MIRPIQLTVACVALMIASAGHLNAGVIRSAVAGSTTMGENPGSVIANLSNQSGLTNSFMNGVTDFGVYTGDSGSTHSDVATNNWESAFDFNTLDLNQLNFDLGAEYTISNIAIWGRNPVSVTLLKFNYETSNDVNFATGVTTETDLSVTIGGVGLIPVRVVDVMDTAARYVRLTITEITGGVGPVGLGEIAFDDATAVPEPSSMAILGLGACYFAARRRRRGKRQ